MRPIDEGKLMVVYRHNNDWLRWYFGSQMCVNNHSCYFYSSYSFTQRVIHSVYPMSQFATNNCTTNNVIYIPQGCTNRSFHLVECKVFLASAILLYPRDFKYRVQPPSVCQSRRSNGTADKKFVIPPMKDVFQELFLELVSSCLILYFVCHLSLNITHFAQLNIQRCCRRRCVPIDQKLACITNYCVQYGIIQISSSGIRVTKS